MENRLLRLVSWGVEFARYFRIPNFLSQLRRTCDTASTTMDLLEPRLWLSIIHDSTSPRVVLPHLREELLCRGLGDVGCIPILEHIWDSVVPEDFGARGPLGSFLPFEAGINYGICLAWP